MIDNYTRRLKEIRVIDGDTVEGTVDLGFHASIESIKVRLIDVWAPELKAEGGYEAKSYLEEVVSRGDVYLNIPNYNRKSFDRFLGYLYVQPSNTNVSINVNTYMMQRGYV